MLPCIELLVTRPGIFNLPSLTTTTQQSHKPLETLIHTTTTHPQLLPYHTPPPDQTPRTALGPALELPETQAEACPRSLP